VVGEHRRGVCREKSRNSHGASTVLDQVAQAARGEAVGSNDAGVIVEIREAAVLGLEVDEGLLDRRNSSGRHFEH
jgi:hypothetical protein